MPGCNQPPLSKNDFCLERRKDNREWQGDWERDVEIERERESLTTATKRPFTRGRQEPIWPARGGNFPLRGRAKKQRRVDPVMVAGTKKQEGDGKRHGGIVKPNNKLLYQWKECRRTNFWKHANLIPASRFCIEKCWPKKIKVEKAWFVQPTNKVQSFKTSSICQPGCGVVDNWLSLYCILLLTNTNPQLPAQFFFWTLLLKLKSSPVFTFLFRTSPSLLSSCPCTVWWIEPGQAIWWHTY